MSRGADTRADGPAEQSPPDPAAVARQLQERARELARELARLTAPPEAGSTIGFGKRIGDGTTEAVERLSTTAAAQTLSGTLRDIQRALDRIDSGDYGICDGCGGNIGIARLEARPTTTRCRDCVT